MRYQNSQGWFWSCNEQCQQYKTVFQQDKSFFYEIKKLEKEKISQAKGSVGIFSEYGVAETRYMFNDQFAKGRKFAKRQSQWDALFMGIQAMGRDESIINYSLRLLVNVLFNFTIGVIMALIGFLWNLYSFIIEYKANIWVAISFFMLSSLAAFSFAFGWLIAIYFAAAGTVYVGGRFLVAHMRVQNGDQQQHGRRLD